MHKKWKDNINKKQEPEELNMTQEQRNKASTPQTWQNRLNATPGCEDGIDATQKWRHKIDIAELVQKALLHAGCAQHLICDLDAHSPILIELHDLPGIYIELDAKYNVKLSCDLCECNEHIIERSGASLFKEHLKHADCFKGGQVTFSEVNDRIRLRVYVKSNHLEHEERMAHALNVFFECLSCCAEHVK